MSAKDLTAHICTMFLATMVTVLLPLTSTYEAKLCMHLQMSSASSCFGHNCSFLARVQNILCCENTYEAQCTRSLHDKRKLYHRHLRAIDRCIDWVLAALRSMLHALFCTQAASRTTCPTRCKFDTLNLAQPFVWRSPQMPLANKSVTNNTAFKSIILDKKDLMSIYKTKNKTTHKNFDFVASQIVQTTTLIWWKIGNSNDGEVSFQTQGPGVTRPMTDN